MSTSWPGYPPHGVDLDNVSLVQREGLQKHGDHVCLSLLAPDLRQDPNANVKRAYLRIEAQLDEIRKGADYALVNPWHSNLYMYAPRGYSIDLTEAQSVKMVADGVAMALALYPERKLIHAWHWGMNSDQGVSVVLTQEKKS